MDRIDAEVTAPEAVVATQARTQRRQSTHLFMSRTTEVLLRSMAYLGSVGWPKR